MAFGIPNKADALYPRQAGGFSSDMDTLAAALAGDAVLSGMGVSAQGTPDMTVAVAAGLVRIGGYFAAYAGANVTITAADGSNPRIDLICCDYNGTVSRVGGTAAARPVPPAIPSNSIQLAQVYVAAAVTTIVSGAIKDKRPVGVDHFDVFADFLSSSLSNTAATSAGSIGECGWTLSGTTAAPTFQTSAAGHPGVLRSATGTTSGNNCRFHFGNASTSAIIVPADLRRMRFIVSIPTITTGAWKVGFGQDLNDAASSSFGTAGAFVEFVPASSAKWAYVTRQASTSTRNVDTGADVVAGNWYQFDIIFKQNGNIQFLKNEVLAFEHSTNLPTTAGNAGTLTHTLTAAARNLDHDLFGMNYAASAARYT